MNSGSSLTDHQAKYFAHQLERSYSNDHVGKLAGLLFDAQVEPKPHQIDAALFALQTPYQRGVILADEVGLGKTIEAGIVMSQYWAERKRRILIIAPASLRQQWKQELWEKFMLPAELLDKNSILDYLNAKAQRNPSVLICSYEFARANQSRLLRQWDLIVADEAHRLRNFWTGRSKIAASIAEIFRRSAKVVLLTATPLQNKLEELHGLVSTFDPEFFHSLEAFKERYIKGNTLVGGDDLAERLRTISKRTLRRDAHKYIQFTKRIPLTIEFDPSPEEVRLYELVDDYLQRDNLYAFARAQRYLSAMIIRKRLGSSTFAVAATLEHISDRLEKELKKGVLRDGRGALFEYEATDLNSDEFEEFERNVQTSCRTEISEEMRDEIIAEIEELRRYAALARSIKVNQKAVHVREALNLGFKKLREVGAPEKAIIFTDSTVTQQYLAEHLRSVGYGDGLVLFNGDNKSETANQIYQCWLANNEGSDIVTGVQSADRRKALVDYFRDHGTIMIATEAASEGVNLQFASMLINYDLPWNPQRVEQRIGRIHRFGQKFDVVIANFSNKGNTAEQRILELLDEKLKLFSKVFDASDEILGSIEDGIDMERRINNILSEFKTEEEINAAFDELEKEYAREISQEMSKAKEKIFDSLDPHVQDRLKNYDKQSGVVLNQFERLLITLTEYELREYATFDAADHSFSLDYAPLDGIATGEYFFKSSPKAHAHQYRYASPLARYVIDTALMSPTPLAELTFSLSRSERASKAVKELVGISGQLVVRKQTFSIQANGEDLSESYLLAAAATEDGRILDNEFVDDILNLVAISTAPTAEKVEDSVVEAELRRQAKYYDNEVKTRNKRYYDEQEDVTFQSLQDRKAEHEMQIRDWNKQIIQLRDQAKNAVDASESLMLKRKSNKLEDKIDDADEEFKKTKRRMRDESNDYLDSVEQALRGSESQEPILAIRWRITE